MTGRPPTAPEPESPPGTARLNISGVFRTFEGKAGSIAALEGIDLSVAPGEFLCLVGPSGCGKSTLLNVIAGLDRPTRGDVRCDGRTVSGPGVDRIVIFQEPALFPWLTVLGNVEFGLKMTRVDTERRRWRALDALKLVRLLKFQNSWVHELSGGMKQRVALARALVMDPKILLMDEPFAALDAQTRDLLHEEVEDLWRRTGMTIVFVTHNVREAVRLGDRVVLMTASPGRIKRQYQVALPRPRHIEDDGVWRLAREVTADLRGEVEKVVKEELERADES